MSGELPNPFSRSAETGRSLASQITRAWAIASSRVTRPSRRPSKPADAPLEVANALKPIAAIIRAEPPSHTFAMTNGSGDSCRARNCLALSAWVTLFGVSFIERWFAWATKNSLDRVRTELFSRTRARQLLERRSSAAFSRSRPRSISASVAVSGGAIRMTPSAAPVRTILALSPSFSAWSVTAFESTRAE